MGFRTFLQKGLYPIPLRSFFTPESTKTGEVTKSSSCALLAASAVRHTTENFTTNEHNSNDEQDRGGMIWK